MNNTCSSIFNDVTFWLRQLCRLPYTLSELESLGCLGFDIAHNQGFAETYMQKLLGKRYLITENKKVDFATLNVQLYEEVISSADTDKIPNWVKMNRNNSEDNPIKSKIARLYKKKAQNREGQKSDNDIN